MDIDEFLDTASDVSETKSSGTDWQKKVETFRVLIDQHLANNDYAQAQKQFTELKKIASDYLIEHKDFYAKMQSIIQSTQSRLSDALKRLQNACDQYVSQIEQLLQLIQNEMQQGDLKTAFSLYAKAQGIYKKIPNEFAQQKTRAQNQMLQIYLELKKTYAHSLELKATKTKDQFMLLYESAKNASADVRESYILQLESFLQKISAANPNLYAELSAYMVSLRSQKTELPKENPPALPVEEISPVVPTVEKVEIPEVSAPEVSHSDNSSATSIKQPTSLPVKQLPPKEPEIHSKPPVVQTPMSKQTTSIPQSSIPEHLAIPDLEENRMAEFKNRALKLQQALKEVKSEVSKHA